MTSASRPSRFPLRRGSGGLQTKLGDGGSASRPEQAEPRSSSLMGRRKLPPPIAPSVAGRKRKARPSSSPPLSSTWKLRRTHDATSGWASLPDDLIHLVTSRLLLSGDVVDYISFRAVCSGWRASTPSPRDPTLRKPDLRPRAWVALCDGDAVRPDTAREITFFHTRTARRLRVPLPELRGHRIVGFTEGLVILLHKRTFAVRVLNPFTRDAVDLPSLVPVVHEVIPSRHIMLNVNAAVCDSASSPASIAVVAWFPGSTVVLAAEPGRPNWEVLHKRVFFLSVLPCQGRLYATMQHYTEIMQLYPRSARPVLAHVPNGFGDEQRKCTFYLVESGGQVLLAIKHLTVPAPPADPADRLIGIAYNVYAVDVDGGGPLIPVSSLGDRALFLSTDRCLSVSARDLPSLSAGSIYFSLMYDKDPVVVHSLMTGLTERLSTACQIHDGKDRVRPSVRPFTIADHLLTYCHPREWTKGLMFHEYHRIPESFQELRKNIKANDSQVRIPRDARSVFLAMKKHARSPRFAPPSE